MWSRARLRLAALAVLLCSSRSGAAAAGDGWYDAAPLLGWLRPGLRAEAAAVSGVRQLNELPLYDLQVALEPELRRFSVEQLIYFTNRDQRPLRELVLRIHANAVGSRKNPRVRLVRGSCENRSCRVAQTASVIEVRPERPLAPGGRLLVRLSLQGRLDAVDPHGTKSPLEGLGLGGGHHDAGHNLLASGAGISSLANFHAVVARRIGSSWQREDPGGHGDAGTDEIGHVRARIVLPASYRMATNGLILSNRVDLEPKRQRTVEVRAALVRDFVVLASQAFESRQRVVGDVNVVSHFLKGDAVSGAAVLDVAAAALRVFESRFGAYPYQSLSLVQAPLPEGVGGVEFSGLATVASALYRPPSFAAGPWSDLLGSSGAESELWASLREFVAAHEVAHQWWHVLVGSDSRQHPFQDEALAQYSTLVYLEHRYGAARASRDAALNLEFAYQLMRLLGEPDAPADRPVRAFTSRTAYAGLVYGKAPYLYAELRRTLGDTKFFGGLREYVKTQRFRIASPRALFDILARAEHAAQVARLTRHWLSEAHGDRDLGQFDPSRLLEVALGFDSARADGSSPRAPRGTGAPSGLDLDALLKGFGPALQGDPGARR